MEPRKTRPRSSFEGGSDPTNFFGRLKAEKVGSLPPNLVFFAA
jgi:hypothetical protein